MLAPYSLHMLKLSEYGVYVKQILLWCKYYYGANIIACNICATTVQTQLLCSGIKHIANVI